MPQSRENAIKYPLVGSGVDENLLARQLKEARARSAAQESGKIEKAAQGVKFAGKAIKNIGRGAEATGKASKLIGRGVKTVGFGLNSLGTFCVDLGITLSATFIGAILGIPLFIIGIILKIIGTASRVGGEGLKISGKAAEVSSRAAKKAGEQIEKGGQAIQKKIQGFKVVKILFSLIISEIFSIFFSITLIAIIFFGLLYLAKYLVIEEIKDMFKSFMSIVGG